MSFNLVRQISSRIFSGNGIKKSLFVNLSLKENTAEFKWVIFYIIFKVSVIHFQFISKFYHFEHEGHFCMSILLCHIFKKLLHYFLYIPSCSTHFCIKNQLQHSKLFPIIHLLYFLTYFIYAHFA